MFANICACTLHAYDDPKCWQMRRQGRMIRQWGTLCDKVWLYNYNYTMLVSKFTLTPMVSRVRRNLSLLSPFLGYEPYAVYGPDWEAKRMRQLAEKTGGTNGQLVAVLPEAARGRTDPFDDGRFERWQDRDFDDSGWKSLLTTRGWEDQGFTDAEGHAYRGVMWYRVTVDLPADVAGKSLWLYATA